MMIQMPKSDVEYVVSRLPVEVSDLVKRCGLMVAGGFIRSTIAGEPVQDVDLFGSDAEVLKTLAQRLFLDQRARSSIIVTENAVTVPAADRLPVQFITKWTFERPSPGLMNPPSVVELLSQFDFTIAQACIWHDGSQWFGMCSERYYMDLSAKRLVYTVPKGNNAGGSVLRLCKFLRRGYVVQPDSLGKLLASFYRQIDYSTGAETVDVIVGLLKEIDPSLVDRAADERI